MHSKRMAGAIAGTVLLMMIGLLGMPKAEAASGGVYMKIYNMKTDTEKVIVWKPNAYRFEKKATIDVDDKKANKIAKMFNTTELNLRNTVTSKPQTATWHHFVVTISSDAYKQVRFL